MGGYDRCLPAQGDPAAAPYVVELVKQLLGKKPMFGICMGHQVCSAPWAMDHVAFVICPRNAGGGQHCSKSGLPS